MKNNNIISIISMLAVSFFLASKLYRYCGKDTRYYPRQVELFNNSSPKPFPFGYDTMYLSKIEVDEDYLIYHLRFDCKHPESAIILDSLKEDDNLKDGLLISFLLGSDGQVGEKSFGGQFMMNELVSKQLGLKLIAYKSTSSFFEYKATYDQVQAFANYYESSPKKALRHYFILDIMLSNIETPNDLGDGLVLNKTLLESDNIVYLLEMDEDLYDMDYVVSIKEQIKHDNVELLREQVKDSNVRQFLNVIRFSRSNIIYRYIGSRSGKKVDIVITPEDLSGNYTGK